MNLYQLSASYQRLMASILEADELTPEVLSEIEFAHDSLEKKILNYTSIVKTLESEAEAISYRVDEMERRQNKLLEKASKMREAIKSEMLSCNRDKIENEYHSVKTRLNPCKVEFSDRNLLPPRFIKEKITTTNEPDKVLILEELKRDKHVPGAYMTRSSRLEIK